MQELNAGILFSAAGGDSKAFKAVYEHYSPFLWKVIFRTVNGDIHAAEEILQNVFVKVHAAIKGFRQQAAVSTWMYRIAYTESIAWLDNRAKQQRKLIPLSALEHSALRSDAYDFRDLVSRILATLSGEERFLLVAREINDVSFEELALVTDKSSGALRVMLHRIKEKIKEGFSDEYRI
jgi:RNA polymerase sigma-70 factor (ECF subfamily)